MTATTSMMDTNETAACGSVDTGSRYKQEGKRMETNTNAPRKNTTSDALHWPEDKKQIITSALIGAGAALAISAVLIGTAIFLDAKFPLPW